MIIDHDLEISTAEVVTVTAASADHINAGKAGDAHKPLYLVIDCIATATAAGAATVDFSLQCHDEVSFNAPKTLFTTGAIALADMVAGKRIAKVMVPAGMEQFVRMYYTVATGPLLTGSFSAYLVAEPA